MQTERCMTATVCEREREKNGRKKDLLIILTSGKFTKLSSIHPSIHPFISPSIPPSCVLRAALTAWGCWWDSPSPFGEYWLVPTHTGLKRIQHLLYLTPLYTKLNVIPQSMSKMGLLGALSFSLALVSLTQVNIIFYAKTWNTDQEYGYRVMLMITLFLLFTDT